MSMREEDRQKNNNCPSRGLGLAAAALGVGVGAALYYFLSKKPENPDGEGSTTGWSCEPPHTFNLIRFNESDTSMENNCSDSTTTLEDSYTTVSETTTTDTSINSDSDSESDTTYIDVIPNFDGSFSTQFTDDSDGSFSTQFTDDSDGSFSTESDGSFSEWDVTNSSLDVPSEEHRAVSPIRMMIGSFGFLFSPRPSERRRRRRTPEEEHRDILRAQALSKEEHIKFLKTQKFRERSWSLEECSICFEIMLQDQQLTSLPCSHNFHSACLAPWLAEQQTCPNCRKAAE